MTTTGVGGSGDIANFSLNLLPFKRSVDKFIILTKIVTRVNGT